MNTTLKILIIALLLCAFGILAIYSSNYRKEGQVWELIYQKQILWVIIGMLAFHAASRFNYRHLLDATYVLYGLTVFLLFLVFILGIVRLGAQRWISLSWFNLQPSEVAKLIMVIFFAKYFSRKSADNVSPLVRRYGFIHALIVPFLFVFVPVGLIIEQPDLGSATIVFLLFLCMLYLSGIRMRYVFSLLGAIAAALPFGWNFLRDYQKERILVFLNPNIDPLGAGYTVLQARIAVGSGGFFGKGWLSGTQSQLHFLPESHTDFIFSTFTEEWGFVGAIVILGLYFALVTIALRTAEKTSDRFGKLLALGIGLMVLIQVAVNIAMNIGLAPVVGIPLPLMSYGGSSVITTFTALGILANINKTRAVF